MTPTRLLALLLLPLLLGTAGCGGSEAPVAEGCGAGAEAGAEAGAAEAGAAEAGAEAAAPTGPAEVGVPASAAARRPVPRRDSRELLELTAEQAELVARLHRAERAHAGGEVSAESGEDAGEGSGGHVAAHAAAAAVVVTLQPTAETPHAEPLHAETPAPACAGPSPHAPAQQPAGSDH